MQDIQQFREIMRDDALSLVIGSVMSFAGLALLVIASLRRRQKEYSLFALGIFVLLYGVRLLLGLAAVQLPLDISARTLGYTTSLITYMIPIPVLVFWREFVSGHARKVVGVVTLLQVVVSALEVAVSIAAHDPPHMMWLNNVVVILGVGMVGVLVAVDVFRHKRPGFAVLGVACVLNLLAVVYQNVASLGTAQNRFNPEPPTFFIFICCLGYVAALDVFSKERRLLSIESELEIARNIQQSILPQHTPELESVSIAARYLPMTSVAGDFYDFLRIDNKRVGVLVADVSGHGVPAALIASMVKMALHSLADRATDPSAVVAGLNDLLSGQLRGQFVTAAYLLVDMERRLACYSAAGHPPLLLSRANDPDLQSIESNGLLIGVMKGQQYPVTQIRLRSRDRLLLYSDGLIEAENAAGESFEETLSQRMSGHRDRTAAATADALVAELRAFAGPEPQDDTTIVLVDLL